MLKLCLSVAAVLGMGGGVLVGGLPGMPAMVQQVPGAVQQLGLIGMPRFRGPSTAADLASSSETAVAAGLQLQQLARAAAAQQQAAALSAGSATANLLAHPLLGGAGGGAAVQPGPSPSTNPGVFLLPRLP